MLFEDEWLPLQQAFDLFHPVVAQVLVCEASDFGFSYSVDRISPVSHQEMFTLIFLGLSFRRAWLFSLLSSSMGCEGHLASRRFSLSSFLASNF